MSLASSFRDRARVKKSALRRRSLTLETLESRTMMNASSIVAQPLPTVQLAGAAAAEISTMLPVSPAIEELAASGSKISETPKFDFGDTSGQATPFKLRQDGTALIAGALPSGDHDWLKFRAIGGRMYVSTTSSSQSTATVVEVWTWKNGNFVSIGAGGSFNFTTSHGKDYWLHIRPQWPGAAIGKYTVSLQTAPKSAVASARLDAAAPSLIYGGVISGTISAAGEVDTYTFSGNAGDVVQLAMQTSGFAPRAKLYDPAGRDIATLTKTGRTYTFTLQSTGTYSFTIQASDLLHTGSYQIGLERVSSPSPDAVSLLPGSVLAGTISKGLEKDQYKIVGKAGDQFQLAFTGSGIVPYAKLYDPTGRDIGTMTQTGHTYTLTMNSAGTYILQIQDWNLVKTGSYKIGLERIYSAPSPDAVALPVGSTKSGRIVSELQKDQYKIYLKAGQTIQFRFASSAINFYAKLYDPSGRDVSTMTVTNRTYTFTARTTGTYILQIQDWNLVKKGTYTVSTNRV
jgi:plastocyanin